MPEVILTVSGQRYGGWKSIRINRGIEQIAGTFDLSVSERWPEQTTARPIRPGEACTVAIDGEVVITGYVDEVSPNYDKDAHAVSVSGRDATGDLVDCSAIHGSGEWSGRTLTQIAADLCQPFGISVKAETDAGEAFPKWSIQEGETVFECLERAARIRGVLLISDGKGGLVICRAGIERLTSALVQGENILSAEGNFSHKDRHSRYIVKAQNAGSDWSTPEQNSCPKAEAEDPAISRYRPLIVIAEDQGDATKLKDRAIWESTVRAGRGSRVTIVVQGWKHSCGLWQSNKLVWVNSDFLAVGRDLLLVSVTFTLDAGGSKTELGLCDREAFELLPLPETKKDQAW